MEDSRRCTATANSTGERCKNAAIKGGNVCRVHGGSAPQVKQKAQERLDRMADDVTADAEDKLQDFAEQYDATDDLEEKAAIIREIRQWTKLILDRTGHGPTEKREVDADHTHDIPTLAELLSDE